MENKDKYSQCSRQGLTMRKNGMYERERKTRKWGICVLYTVCAIFCAIIGSVHAWRALNAKKLNDSFPDFK